MTPLLKPVRRLVAQGELVATMTLEGLYVRDKGRRTELGPIPWGSLYLEAARRTAIARKLAPKRPRKSRPRVQRGGLR